VASKKASRQHWLGKPANRDHFCGVQHVNRVQAWREKHPEYGRKRPISVEPLQEMIMGQSVDRIEKYGDLPLQEEIERQVGEPVEEIGI